MLSFEKSGLSSNRLDWLTVAILGVVATAGVGLGLAWLALGSATVLVALISSYIRPRPAQYLSLLLLLVTPFLMVATPLRPGEYNYTAYAAVLLCIIGGISALKYRHRIGAIDILLFWLVGSAIVATLRLQPEPLYSIMVAPLGLLGTYLLLSNAGKSVRRLFVYGILAVMAVEASIGILQTLSGFPTFSRWDDRVFSDSRNYLAILMPGLPSQVRMATGTFQHFNGLGALLCTAVPLAFSRGQERKSLPRVMYFLLVGVGLVCTFSRGALLGAVFAVGAL